jgi:hypothetical protein
VARIRSVKPAYWSDGAIKRLRDPSALFFISLWNFADDAGFFTLDTLELSLKIPRWKPQAIAKMIKSLSDAGLVRVSTKSGVGQVVHWRHQKIDKPRASEWEGKQIQWDAPVDSPNDIEPSPTVRRKDRIGEDRKGSGEDHCDVPAVVAKPPRNPVEKKSEPSQANEILARYCECFKARYGSNPPIRGKEAGLAKRLAKDLPISRVLGLIETYLSMNDPYFVTRRHDLGTFSLSLNAVAVRHDTGLNLTQTEIRQADRAQATANAFDFALANFRGPSNGNV